MTTTLSLVKSEIFEGNQADFYSDNSMFFMTIDQLARCLGYTAKAGIEMLIKRNDYLKNEEFSTTHRMLVLEGNRKVTREMRLFSEDGIYEIAFLSKTAIAQLFRAWVRKILKQLRQQAQTTHQQLTTGNPLLDESYYHLQESTKFNTECLENHEWRIIDVENQVKDHEEQIAEVKQDIDTLKQAPLSHANYRQFTKDCMAAFSMDTYEFRRWARKAVIAISSKENIHTNSVYSDLYNEMDKDGEITSFRDSIKRDADWLYRLVKVNGKWQRREKRINNVFDAITMYHDMLPHVPRTYRDSFTKLILDRLEA